MLRISVFLYFVFMVSSGFAQCIADAGPNRVVCSELQYGLQHIQIGPEEDSIPGYTYTWEAYHVYQTGPHTFIYWASDLLNDTTVLHPTTIGEGFEEPVEFVLHVTDNNGNTCSDTTTVQYSMYGTHLGSYGYSIELGDSVFLSSHNLDGGIPPLEFIWRPNHGLTDSTLESGFWVKPEVSTDYYITITDSAGCVAVGAPVYSVYVVPVSTDNIETQSNGLSVFPNPSKDVLNVTVGDAFSQTVLFRITDMVGRTVKEHLLGPEQNNINISDLGRGTYLYTASTSRRILGQGNLFVP